MVARNFKDITGQRFGRLTAIERAPNKGGNVYWRCRCDCGTECTVLGTNLRRGRTRSCGCLQKEHGAEAGKASATHGMTNTKAHRCWQSIKRRCFNPNCKDFKDYGGRGITVYEPWIHDFPAFYDYVSQLPHFGEEGMTLDRIDNDGNYEPGNLRWITAQEQNRNTSRNIIVEYNGEEMTLTDAAEKAGLPAKLVWGRRRIGWSDEYLFIPKQGTIRKH